MPAAVAATLVVIKAGVVIRAALNTNAKCAEVQFWTQAWLGSLCKVCVWGGGNAKKKQTNTMSNKEADYGQGMGCA